MKLESLARAYGGWLWLRQEIHNEVAYELRQRDPEVVEIEHRIGAAPRAVSESARKRRELEERLGGNPWYPDSHFHIGPRAVGVFYVPVRMLKTDLKSHVRARLTAVFDELWKNLGLKSPKSTGMSGKRSLEWDRYLEWLWRNRVQGEAVEDFADEYKSRTGDWGMTTRAIQNGIDLAIRTLGAF